MSHHYKVYQGSVWHEFILFLDIIEKPDIADKYRIMATFVLCTMMRNNPEAQIAIVGYSKNKLLQQVETVLNEQRPSPELRKWLLLCIGISWENNERVRSMVKLFNILETIGAYLEDSEPEVRAAAVFALGTLIKSTRKRNDKVDLIDKKIMEKVLLEASVDGSMLVRQEVLLLVQYFVNNFEYVFVYFMDTILQEVLGMTGRFNSSLHQTQQSSFFALAFTRKLLTEN